MTVYLPDLPYDKKALAPYISAETLSFHHDKHHAAYVKNTNDLIAHTPLADKQLPEIILTAAADTILTPVFNNAAQCYNHEFYWNSLAPNHPDIPKTLEQALIKDFGSVQEFKKAFHSAASSRFGSGWCWLVQAKDKSLKILTTGNAETPITGSEFKPLLCVDVWEHAYYLDYQNRRGDYLSAVIDNLLNWNFAEQNMR